MADIAESAPFTDPAIAISQGKRHLLVRDYSMAASALAQACQLLAEKHGDTGDELGEPYLLYGRALLGLAREEAGVLGGGVPGTEDIDEEDEDEDEEELEDDKLSNADAKDEEPNEGEAEGEGDGKKEQEESAKAEKQGSKEKATTGEEKTEDAEVSESSSRVDTKADQSEAGVKGSQPASAGDTAKTSPAKETAPVRPSNKSEDVSQSSKTEDSAVAGSSKGTASASSGGSAASVTENGKPKKHGEGDEGEDITNDEAEDEDDVNNLQVAWEVLELAKLVLSKRGQAGWKQLADAYRLLGEVAMEGGNHQGALSDLHGCLELLQKIEPRDARAIAEIHYQLALAHSLGNDFDASVEEFRNATELLKTRIEELEQIKEPPKTDDTFYTVEGEINELKELLPEIEEKINDMKDFKQEACRLVIEGIKSKVAGGSCTNGAGPSKAEAASTTSKVQKPASDISHLVRKKRKADEPDSEIASPCKKPTPEKIV